MKEGPTKLGINFKSMLTFIESAGKNKWHIKLGKYLCECGNEIIGSISSVEHGKIKSCGCLKVRLIGEKSKTHGLSKHTLYHIWGSIIARCEDEKNNRFHRYGGKGVKICEKWRNDFKAFYDWAIENGWRKGLQIDKDIKGNGLLYSPETCSVVTGKQNSNKRSNNRFETYKGITKTVAEWAEEKNINPFLIYKRLKRGWSIADAIETPLIVNSKKIKNVL